MWDLLLFASILIIVMVRTICFNVVPFVPFVLLGYRNLNSMSHEVSVLSDVRPYPVVGVGEKRSSFVQPIPIDSFEHAYLATLD